MQRLQDESRVEEAVEGNVLSRRGLLIGSLRVAGGGSLALAVAASPGFLRSALAQEDYGNDDGGDGDTGGTTTAGATTAAPAAAPAAAPTTLPNTGVGSAGQRDGLTAGLVGLAAAGAAAAFFLRGAARDERADA